MLKKKYKSVRKEVAATHPFVHIVLDMVESDIKEIDLTFISQQELNITALKINHVLFQKLYNGPYGLCRDFWLILLRNMLYK